MPSSHSNQLTQLLDRCRDRILLLHWHFAEGVLRVLLPSGSWQPAVPNSPRQPLLLRAR